jgi:hypothetical protein
MSMVRLFAVGCTAFAFLFLLSAGSEGALNQKPQMVKGTIKDIQVEKNVLVVNQKVKNEFVTRELSIEKDTEFVVMKGDSKKTATGRDGLVLLDELKLKDASVQVKCDKDVKVLQVTVKTK